MKVYSGVYQILNKINGKRYIGSSKTIYKRKSQHLRELSQNKHLNLHLQNAWNKYGKEAFEFSTIIACDIKDMLFYEDLVIKIYQSNKKQFGYNLREVVNSNKGLHTVYHPGDKFNRLTFIRPSERIGYWVVRCDCGVEKESQPNPIKTGKVKSCGCLNKELASLLMKKQHADLEWLKKQSELARLTMIKTMSRKELREMASIHAKNLNKDGKNRGRLKRTEARQ